MTSLIVPVLTAGVILAGLLRRVDVYGAFVAGAKRGLGVCLRILPSLAAMLSLVTTLRASGLLDAVQGLLAPALRVLGIPGETAPLLLLRPLSGSGALAVGSDLMRRYGTETLVGRTAAVMLGSTETTFYTVSVYFGSLGIRDARYAIPAALAADFTAYCAASLAVRYLM